MNAVGLCAIVLALTLLGLLRGLGDPYRRPPDPAWERHVATAPGARDSRRRYR